MEWISLASAALAGGFAGQLITLFFGDRLGYKRDFKNWLRTERFTLFSELLTLSSSTNPECGYEKWPGQIRAMCQRVYLLYPNGKPPKSLVEAMENIFQLAYSKKKGKVEDVEKWTQDIRKESSKLREELAKCLHEKK